MKIKTKIIGLAGPIGVGKSTVAKALNHYAKYRIESFAAPMRDMLAAIGVPRLVSSSPIDKEKPLAFLFGKDTTITARRLMQTLGTEWGRQTVGENVWCDLMEFRIKHLVEQRGDHLRALAVSLADVREKVDKVKAGEADAPEVNGEVLTVEAMDAEIARMQAHFEEGHTIYVVIDDVRFENEAEVIEKLGGVVHYLVRTGVEGDDAHPSEHGFTRLFTEPLFIPEFRADERGIVEETPELIAFLNKLDSGITAEESL